MQFWEDMLDELTCVQWRTQRHLGGAFEKRPFSLWKNHCTFCTIRQTGKPSHLQNRSPVPVSWFAIASFGLLLHPFKQGKYDVPPTGLSYGLPPFVSSTTPLPDDRTAKGFDLPSITMTTFVDFVVAGSGTPKLTAVKNAKSQYERGYDPTEDFYKPLRGCIAEAAQKNLKGAETLDAVRSTLVKLDRKKLNAYQECGEGYKKWRGRRDIVWDRDFNPQDSSEWSHDRLVVRVKPEIGLLIKGVPHIVKLYFKAPQLSQLRLETIYYLLRQYEHKGHSNFDVGILELRRGRLRVPNRNIPDIGHLLAGEAAAFQTMWESL